MCVGWCVGCLADKASPLSWRVLGTPSQAPLEFMFRPAKQRTYPFVRFGRLLLCPGGVLGTPSPRNCSVLKAFSPQSKKHPESQTRLLLCPGGVLGTPSPRNCSVLKAFSPESKKILLSQTLKAPRIVHTHRQTFLVHTC